MMDGLNRYKLYELGWAMNAAMNDPKALKKLMPQNQSQMPTSGPLKPSKKGKVAKTHG